MANLRNWQDIMKEIEHYCEEKYSATGISFIFSKRSIIFHLKISDDEMGGLRKALYHLLKNGKIVKYTGNAYKWNII
jgi:hypothetical protein